MVVASERVLVLGERPPDTAGDLRYADAAGQVRVFGEVVHQVAPRLRPLFPGAGVARGVDECQDTISDEDHGQEVLGALCIEEHGSF